MNFEMTIMSHAVGNRQDLDTIHMNLKKTCLSNRDGILTDTDETLNPTMGALLGFSHRVDIRSIESKMDSLQHKRRVPSHSVGLVTEIHTALADRTSILFD